MPVRVDFPKVGIFTILNMYADDLSIILKA